MVWVRARGKDMGAERIAEVGRVLRMGVTAAQYQMGVCCVGHRGWGIRPEPWP